VVKSAIEHGRIYGGSINNDTMLIASAGFLF
jgi:hypothetical protein